MKKKTSLIYKFSNIFFALLIIAIVASCDSIGGSESIGETELLVVSQIETIQDNSEEPIEEPIEEITEEITEEPQEEITMIQPIPDYQNYFLTEGNNRLFGLTATGGEEIIVRQLAVKKLLSVIRKKSR